MRPRLLKHLKLSWRTTMTILIAATQIFLTTLTKKLWIGHLMADLLHKVSVGAKTDLMNWIGAFLLYTGVKYSLAKKKCHISINPNWEKGRMFIGPRKHLGHRAHSWFSMSGKSSLLLCHIISRSWGQACMCDSCSAEPWLKKHSVEEEITAACSRDNVAFT